MRLLLPNASLLSPRFQGSYLALGFSPWKKPLVRAFLPEAQISFVRNLRSLPQDAGLVVWGRSFDAKIQNAIDSGRIPPNTQVIRLEDGFLRSVGLGASLTRPVSWVADPVGIYYDATAPSALENLLLTHPFPEDLLARARALHQRILELNLTKYNLASSSWNRPAGSQRVILVPGQVERDASLRFGSQFFRSNLELLQAVRKTCPDAFLIYKPHPDVAAGLRAAGPTEFQTSGICDAIVNEVSMADLLPHVDELHLRTSLSGFEALLRGKKVVCYGAPFYSGWGLTTDLQSVPRRSRILPLEALVAATLILYPRYLSRHSRKLTTPENTLSELAEWRKLDLITSKKLTSRILNSIHSKCMALANRLYDTWRTSPI